MQSWLGLIEMLVFFGLVLGWAGWQVWDYRKWKRAQQSAPAPAVPPKPPLQEQPPAP